MTYTDPVTGEQLNWIDDASYAAWQAEDPFGDDDYEPQFASAEEIDAARPATDWNPPGMTEQDEQAQDTAQYEALCERLPDLEPPF